MTRRMRSASSAEMFGTAHEQFSGNPLCEQQMDLHNNDVGRQVGSSGADCGSGCDPIRNSGLQTAPQGPCTPCGSGETEPFGGAGPRPPLI